MVDLNALIDEALNLAYHGARAQDQSFNITLERGFAEGIAPIEVAPQDMTRVFLNLFSNGFYAATRRARKDADAGFMPTLKVTTRDTGEAVEIHVRDNGIGISADIRTSCSSHSSLPSRPVRALVSACRSPTTSSRSSMAAASRWTARSANTASSRYGCRAVRKRHEERPVSTEAV